MTMESWMQPPVGNESGGTFSHPWTAAPAVVVPRFLMGIRPLQDSWQRVAVRPLPSRSLKAAFIVVPSLRGIFALSFRATQNSFNVSLTLPGNTLADLCLPLSIYSSIAPAGTAVGAGWGALG